MVHLPFAPFILISPCFTLFLLPCCTICCTISRMGTITKRKRKNGTFSYRAQVRVQRGGNTLKESQTFRKLANARAWIRKRESDLDDQEAFNRVLLPCTTIHDLIHWYISAYRDTLSWGDTKQFDLLRIASHAFGKLDATQLSEQEVIEYARQRRGEGVGAPSVKMDLTWIRGVFKAAQAQEYEVRPEVVINASKRVKELKLTSPSKRRTRRPSPEELAQLGQEFVRYSKSGSLPISDIVAFAIASTRRRSEITRLEWADNDKRTRTGLVRDAKHPTHKKGNHKRFKYTKEAWEIMSRQPRTSKYIFPYDPRLVTRQFANAVKRAGIEDLRFHDLRHEAVSRLFEAGATITEVQQYSLHENWETLRRYTQLGPEKVRQF